MSSENHEKNHSYHLVDPSPWPFVSSVSVFILALGLINYMNEDAFWLLLIGIGLVLYAMYGWWNDVVNEAQHQGHHTPVVQLHHRYGMILFISSEVMFFAAWFWAFFNVSLFPEDVIHFERAEFLGSQWPPLGIEVFDPFHLPLLNTLILLLSSVTITWAHHAILENDRKGLVSGLTCTVILGLTFTLFQIIEYIHAPFAFAGHIYGATFFMATGFHGLHVLIGTIFIGICLFRAMKGHFTAEHHLGLEAAAWYWHFVDVVWLFLFCSIYVWAS